MPHAVRHAITAALAWTSIQVVFVACSSANIATPPCVDAPCYTRSVDKCAIGDGCYLAPTCIETRCTFATQGECESAGCIWYDGCYVIGSDCDSRTESECGLSGHCKWSQTCQGAAPECSNFASQASCLQHECKWMQYQ
ncbi:MAG: hypothetical protein ACREJ3_08960 [Polyangiaceae bacterium]